MAIDVEAKEDVKLTSKTSKKKGDTFRISDELYLKHKAKLKKVTPNKNAAVKAADTK